MCERVKKRNKKILKLFFPECKERKVHRSNGQKANVKTPSCISQMNHDEKESGENSKIEIRRSVISSKRHKLDDFGKSTTQKFEKCGIYQRKIMHNGKKQQRLRKSMYNHRHLKALVIITVIDQ